MTVIRQIHRPQLTGIRKLASRSSKASAFYVAFRERLTRALTASDKEDAELGKAAKETVL